MHGIAVGVLQIKCKDLNQLSRPDAIGTDMQLLLGQIFLLDTGICREPGDELFYVEELLPPRITTKFNLTLILSSLWLFSPSVVGFFKVLLAWGCPIQRTVVVGLIGPK